ncbi:MAG: TIGR00341 family protein [Planctomycetota bacterium]
MSFRLLHLALPDQRFAEVADVVSVFQREHERVDRLQVHRDGDRASMLVLVPAEVSEALLDKIEDAVGRAEGFRVVVQQVEATLPAPADHGESDAKEQPGEAKPTVGRVSRAEIVDDVARMVQLTPVFFAYVVLSAVVSAIGLYRDNVAVLVGAMVIAPLLGPNMALAVATALGDPKLGERALRINALGVVIAAALAVALGFLFPCDPNSAEIRARIGVASSDVVLALAAGGAGAIAVTSGAPTSLVGVMVAVALMPPLVAAGVLVGSGYVSLGMHALHLVAVNVISVNLAAVVTFQLQGIRPRQWWEKERARRAARWALLIWGALLVVLLVLMQV